MGEIVLCKTACMGLTEDHVGKTLRELEPHLLKLNKDFGMHLCGEGGEYETLTLDSPLFTKRVALIDSVNVVHSEDSVAPVVYLKTPSTELVEKAGGQEVQLPISLDDLQYYEDVFPKAAAVLYTPDDAAPLEFGTPQASGTPVLSWSGALGATSSLDQRVLVWEHGQTSQKKHVQ